MNPQRIGPYEITEKLGAGGMGSVYLGRHCETGEQAAVKVLPPTLAATDGFVERFSREVEAMRKFDHPHIVRLLDSGCDGETYYFGMEYVPGETLMALLRREKRIPWQRAVVIGRQICLALKAAHDAGVVHRDLKPSNLMITKEGNVKLTDFGVAQVFASSKLTVTGGVIGTAEYMSPEQAQGQRATRQSDVYSLGAVLYAMITGRPPFTGQTAIDVIQKHKFGLFDSPRKYVPELPVALDQLICRCLEKNPTRRYADAYVLLRDLDKIKPDVVTLGEEGLTLDGGDEIDPSAPTLAPPVRSGTVPGPATMMKNLVRAELQADSQQQSEFMQFLSSAPVLIITLAAVIGLGVWLWQTSGNPVSGEDDVESTATDEASRLLSIAQQYRKTGDLSRAEQILTALLAVLPNDDSSSSIRRKAELQLKRIATAREGTAGSGPFAESALQRAADLAKQGKVAAARGIYRGLIDLYSLDSSAGNIVQQAENQLAKLNGTEKAADSESGKTKTKE